MRKGKLIVPHPRTPPRGGAANQLAALNITVGAVSFYTKRKV